MGATTDATAVQEVNQAFYSAFEALDLGAMSSVWAEEQPISCVHPGWEPLAGRAAVMESWAGIFRGTEAIRFTLRDIRVFVTDQTAWVVLIEEIEAQHERKTVTASAQATNVFVREGSRWKLVHHHAGPLLTPAETETDVAPGKGGGRTLH
jgi:ketosteroid isomerase-like protein